MTLARWLRPRAVHLTHRPAPPATHHPAFRPRVEGLEDRSVPSATFGYALDIGSTGQEWPSAVAADPAGDVFLTGHFQGDVNFNPAGASPVVLSSPTAYNQTTQTYYRVAAGFAAKYNPDGTLAWARGGLDWAAPEAMGIAVDGTGDVYLSGGGGTFSYGPTNPDGTPYATHTSLGGEDAYVMKLDSGGNLAWARFMGGAGLDRAVAVAADAAGNVTTTGLFQQTATFGTATLTAKGNQDVFVSRIDPAGNVTWAGQIGGSGADGVGRAVAVDDAGAAYVTGQFDGTMDFDPGKGTVSLSSGGRGAQASFSAFVLKLDAANKLSWAGAFQASTFSSSDGAAIAVDASHNVYVAGSFSGTTDFDPGKGKYSLSSNSTNGYLCKLTSAGQFAWAKSWRVNSTTGSTYNPVTGLAIDGAGNIYISGTIKGAVDLDPGPVSDLVDGGLGDAYVLKLDAGGNFVWAAALGGPGLERSMGLGIDGAGNVYTTGFFEQTANFDPSGTDLLTSAGSQDIFLVKLR